MLRDRVQNALEAKPTLQAVAAFRRLARTFPSESRLAASARTAETSLVFFESRQPDPRELRSVFARRGARLVLGASDLVTIVIECLGEIQNDLLGATPPTRGLWDEQRTQEGKSFIDPKKELGRRPQLFDRFTPKDEGVLSDFLAREIGVRLKGRRVVVNREVEIRRGEKTDIHVTASSTKQQDIVLVVEVKGCWNRELKTAMEMQLLERYLRGKAVDAGLYVVGWYLCERWWNKDHRKAATPEGREDLRAYLKAQADSLAGRGEKPIRSFLLDATIT